MLPVAHAMKSKHKILILGATGMLGSCLYRYFQKAIEFEAYGSYRTDDYISLFPNHEGQHLIHLDLPTNLNSLEEYIVQNDIDTVVNCIGIIKQNLNEKSKSVYIELNAMLPHKLLAVCERVNAFLIHFSTDCVFDGKKGNYSEADKPNSVDIYGLSKLLGEINTDKSLTLRTSIIGHEIGTSVSLIDWCLSQEEQILGYRKAVFSGLPTIEVSKVIERILIREEKITGLFNLAAEPINKFNLLQHVVTRYNKKLKVLPSQDIEIDRSLDATRFNTITSYRPPSWNILIDNMYDDYLQHKQFFRKSAI